MGKKNKTPADQLKELIDKYSAYVTESELEQGIEGVLKDYTAHKELEYEVTREQLNHTLGLSSKSGFVESLFKIFDSDGDGKLLLKELLYGMAVLTSDGNQEQKLLMLFKLYDLGNSGLLGRANIQDMLQASLEENKIVMSEENVQVLVNEIFTSMDADGSGEITFDEFKQYMLAHKQKEMRYLSLSGNKGASEAMERHDSLVRLKLNSPNADSPQERSHAVIDIEAMSNEVEMKSVTVVTNTNANANSSDVKSKADVSIRQNTSGKQLKRKNSSSVNRPMPKITFATLWKRRNLDDPDANRDSTDGLQVEEPSKAEKIRPLSETAKNRKKKKLFLKTYWKFEGMKTACILVWFMVCCAFFANWFRSFADHPLTEIVNYGLPAAKAFSSLINFNSALILLPVCKITLTILRQIPVVGELLPLDKNIVFHRIFASAMALSAMGHIGCHIYNFVKLSSADVGRLNSLTSFQFSPGENTFYFFLFQTIPGMTGVLLVITVAIIFKFANFKSSRRANFNWFFYSHHLFFVFYTLLIIHGFQTLFSFPVTLAYVGFPILVYLFERTVKCIRGLKHWEVVRAEPLVSRVTHLEILKPFHYFSGQYVRINIPELSLLQWHPFTITSAPEQKTFSVNILASGDWTNKLYKLAQDRKKEGLPFPPIRVDGPFGSASEQVFSYKHIVMIGAGIGATPFISVLRHILYRSKNEKALELQKAYFYWVNRDQKNFRWFADTLTELTHDDPNHFLKIRTYLSQATNKNDVRSFLLWAALEEHYKKTKQDLVTGLASRTYWGRPNFKEIFEHMSHKYPGETVGVFFCGPQVMSRELYYLCRRISETAVPGQTVFHYHKENF